MIDVLESCRGRGFLRIVPDLGSRTYLSLMRIAAAIVGNSSSGIFEAPSFKVPAVNIGTRQHGRLRARNVVDVGYDKAEIVSGVRLRARTIAISARRCESCTNPYGDGDTRAAERSTSCSACGSCPRCWRSGWRRRELLDGSLSEGSLPAVCLDEKIPSPSAGRFDGGVETIGPSSHPDPPLMASHRLTCGSRS